MSNMTTATPEEPLFTNFQARFLSFLPLFTATPSWIGSGLIICVIVRERRTLLRKTYHRLMLGLSVFDFIYSFHFAVFAGMWSIPEEDSFALGKRSAKSFVPCSIDGFFTMQGLGSVLYTSSLMVYFVLILHFELRIDFVAQRVEPFMHAVSIVAPVAIGAIAAKHEMINPVRTLPGSCFLFDFPPDCSFDEDVECIREGDGTPAQIILYAMAGLLLAALVFIVVAMALLILKVKRTEERMRRYVGGVLSQSSMKQTRETAIRGLLYIVAFFLFAIPTANILTLESTTNPENRARHLISGIFFLVLSNNQGLFNAVIYLKPRFRELTSESGTLSFLRPLVSFFQQLRCCVILFTCSCCNAICCCCVRQGAHSGLQAQAAPIEQGRAMQAPVAPIERGQAPIALIEQGQLTSVEMHNNPLEQQDTVSQDKDVEDFSPEDNDQEDPCLQDKEEEISPIMETFVNEEELH